MKKIITLFSLMLCMFATAQENVEYMYIHRSNNVVDSIAVTEIDSVTFAIPSAPTVPDVPGSSDLNGHEYVDLGLPSGIKWATCNVGASKPEEYGGYYAWGDTEEKSDYSWKTYKWCKWYIGGEIDMTKYCTRSICDTVDNKRVLDPEDDVAHVKWGGSWRMPTVGEMYELKTECTWTWTTQNGVNGYRVTGPNGNSIFLPAADFRSGTDLPFRGSFGYYWSSSLGTGDSDYFHAECLCFFSDIYNFSYYYRYDGLSVRPVSN